MRCRTIIRSWRAPLITSTYLRMRRNARRERGIWQRRTPSSSSQQTRCFRRSVYPKRKKYGRNCQRKEKFVRLGKICTKQQTGSPRSRSKPWEAKTNLAPLTAHLGRRWNQIKQIKQMVRTGRLLKSTNILTPLLLQLPGRRLFWKNWWGPMQTSPPPTPNFWSLWPASLRPTINSLIGWETAKAIKTKTPGPKRMILLNLRLCVPIVN